MAGSVMEGSASFQLAGFGSQAGSLRYLLQPLHYGNRCDIFKMEKKTPEAIRLDSVSKAVRIFSFICLLAVWIPTALADPVSELASFSGFDKVDLAALSMESGASLGTESPASFRPSVVTRSGKFLPSLQRTR
jgi:hypothetical protein